jgi:hypothetical protein
MISRRYLISLVAASLAVAAPAALAALPGGAKYAGTTSDGKAVSLKLTGDGTHIKRMRIYYHVTCDNGGATDTYTDIRGAQIHKNHGFSVSGTYTGSHDGSKNKFSVSGKVWNKTAHGKFSLSATGKPSGGGGKLHCKTGKLTWSAKRQK